MSPAGRRPGKPDTKSEVLAAAREVFAECGYDRATIRVIAERAGVDPALIHHYFGTKQNLYAASISFPLAPTDVVAEVLSADDPSDRGRNLARLFFTVWESEDARSSLLGILRSAMSGDDRSAEAFREFISANLKAHIAAQIDHDNAELRALAIVGQLVGLAIIRYVTRVEPVASASIHELVGLVSPTIQRYLE